MTKDGDTMVTTIKTWLGMPPNDQHLDDALTEARQDRDLARLELQAATTAALPEIRESLARMREHVVDARPNVLRMPPAPSPSSGAMGDPVPHDLLAAHRSSGRNRY